MWQWQKIQAVPRHLKLIKTMAESEVQSPCIGVCSMDDSTGFCLGCYRTMDEIQGWWDLDNAQKLAVNGLASAREAAQFN